MQPIKFPNTSDGKLVLPIDFHTHTVFSDGYVWPAVQVQEAIKEGLAGIAITDHLEWQPHQADIPNPDKNRSYDLAVEEALRLASSTKTPALTVVLGTEITRGQPIGHLNAVFLTDVNKLLGPGYPVFSQGRELQKFWEPEETLRNQTSLRDALVTARGQGGFIILNHPVFNFDGDGRMHDVDLKLIKDGLINGIEVANGIAYLEAAFQLALDNDLAIIGASDFHSLPDGAESVRADAGVKFPDVNFAHRTCTLILSRKPDKEAIQAAVVSRSTVALYSNQLFGREPDLRAILSSALGVKVRPQSGNDDLAILSFTNKSSIPFTLRYAGKRSFWTSSDTFTIPPGSSIEILVSHVPSSQATAFEPLEVEVLNAYVAPRKHLVIAMRDGL